MLEELLSISSEDRIAPGESGRTAADVSKGFTGWAAEGRTAKKRSNSGRCCESDGRDLVKEIPHEDFRLASLLGKEQRIPWLTLFLKGVSFLEGRLQSEGRCIDI